MNKHWESWEAKDKARIYELEEALKKIANPPKDRNYTGYMKRIATEVLREGDNENKSVYSNR